MRILPTVKLNSIEQQVLIRAEPFVRMWVENYTHDCAGPEIEVYGAALRRLHGAINDVITEVMADVLGVNLMSTRQYLEEAGSVGWWLKHIEHGHREPGVIHMAEVLAESRRDGLGVIQGALDLLNRVQVEIRRSEYDSEDDE